MILTNIRHNGSLSRAPDGIDLGEAGDLDLRTVAVEVESFEVFASGTAVGANVVHCSSSAAD